jgi:hypothetical protein
MISQNQTQRCEQDVTANAQSGESPFLLEFFLIQGLHFRCMGYCDTDGKWRGAFNHFELPGPIRVLA